MNGISSEEQQRQVQPYMMYPPTTMPEFLTKDDKELLKRSLLKKFPEEQQEIFIRRCERSKLDPFSGQLHPTVRNMKVRKENGEVEWIPGLVCVTGIYGLLAVAIRTNEYDGTELFWCGKDGEWQPEWLEDEYPAAAKAIIYLKHRKPEVMIARWFSFVQQTWDKTAKKWDISDFWDRMPDFMLGKCARAGGLRAAFPDQLSEIYIREELGGAELDLDDGSDAAKIAEAQRREKEVKIPGAVHVETRGPRPTPEEAAEPAFEEDKIPPKPGPKFGDQLAKDFPAEAQKTEAKPPSVPESQTKQTQEDLKSRPETGRLVPETTAEDNLDFGDQAAQAAAEPPAAPPAPEPPWKNHVIKGITNTRFFNRKVGDLNEAERMVLESQWLPRIQEQWDKANEAQKADYPMIQAALAFHKLANPWKNK